jgi:predicted RNase H-like HicB family nuclease
MEIKLTAVFRKFPEGYAAFVKELPGPNTQGATLEEARANEKEAVEWSCRRIASWRSGE